MKKIFYQILFLFFYPFIKRNNRFKNQHSNEECYIIGNGKSLKYYNLADFNDKITIGVGAIFLHKDFKKLNTKYYFEGHPFFYYPIWKNVYTHKLEKNILGMFYKKKVIENNDIIFFTSLTNIFSMFKKNIYFLFHFGEKFKSFEDCNIEKRFTTLNSSLAGALGIAINMGFKKITLVGCDYCMYPRSIGHFYENNFFIDYDDYDFNIQNKELLYQAQKKVLIDIIIPNDKYTAQDVNFVLYKKHSGNDPIYAENVNLIDNNYLNILDNSNMQYKIF
jgi:hypothetical protein